MKNISCTYTPEKAPISFRVTGRGTSREEQDERVIFSNSVARGYKQLLSETTSVVSESMCRDFGYPNYGARNLTLNLKELRLRKNKAAERIMWEAPVNCALETLIGDVATRSVLSEEPVVLSPYDWSDECVDLFDDFQKDILARGAGIDYFILERVVDQTAVALSKSKSLEQPFVTVSDSGQVITLQAV